MGFRELYVIRGGFRRKKYTFVYNRKLPCISIAQKFAYQIIYTTVPISWYCSTSHYTPSLVLKCFDLTQTKHSLTHGNTFSQERQSFVKSFYLVFYCFSDALKGKNGRFCIKKPIPPKNRVSNWKEKFLQLETYFFPVGRFFPPNWAFLLYVIMAFGVVPCNSVKILYFVFL